MIPRVDDRCGGMVFPKVLRNFGECFEGFRLGAFGRFEWEVNLLRTLRVAPFLDGFLIANHADAGLVDVEGDIAEALGVQFLDFELVVVEVWRPEQNPAHPALGNNRGGRFRRFHSNTLAAVELIQLGGEDVCGRIAFVEPERAIQGNLKKSWARLALKFHKVACRLFKNQAGQLKKRVGFGGRFDLLEKAIDAARFWQKPDLPALEERHAGCGFLLATLTVIPQIPAWRRAFAWGTLVT